jgi:hypothetical protein
LTAAQFRPNSRYELPPRSRSTVAAAIRGHVIHDIRRLEAFSGWVGSAKLLKHLIHHTVAAAILLTVLSGNAGAQNRGDVYTIAKYPVDASGINAVAAKREATAQGRKSAFRSLLKRLVPATSYGLVEQLAKLNPEPLVGAMRVRSEQNSPTQYIASLDFSFDRAAVRALLNQHGVPYIDFAAPPSSLLLLYTAPAAGGGAEMKANKGYASWRSVWRDLDLANSVAPTLLVPQPPDLTKESIKSLLAADAQTLSALGSRFNTAQLIVAEAHPVPASKELQITLAGQDAVGRFAVTTRYRLDDDDFTYSLELAAVIVQGVLESRWKTQQSGGQTAGADGASNTINVLAEFSNLGQWQRQQQVLANTPGVRNMQIGSLSGRSASVALSFPGGGEALQTALGRQGLVLENINGFWVLR